MLTVHCNSAKSSRVTSAWVACASLRAESSPSEVWAVKRRVMVCPPWNIPFLLFLCPCTWQTCLVFVWNAVTIHSRPWSACLSALVEKQVSCRNSWGWYKGSSVLLLHLHDAVVVLILPKQFLEYPNHFLVCACPKCASEANSDPSDVKATLFYPFLVAVSKAATNAATWLITFSARSARVFQCARWLYFQQGGSAPAVAAEQLHFTN